MKRKPRTIRNIVLVTAGVVTGLLMGAERPVGKETAPAIPKTATVIPAPREMRVTGGEYWAKKPPKMERVDGIPSEGYELSIRPDGMTIRYSDDAGAFAGCESLTAADEATIVTTLSGATVPAYDATAFLGREVSYTPVAGSVARLEAMALVTWLQEQAADSSSAIVQPTSYNTADLETWLDTASNLSAIYAFCWAERYAADAGFQPLTVNGTSFLFTAPDAGTTDSLAVTVVGANDLTDTSGFTADALEEAGTVDGVTTYVSSDATAASCFARLRFAKGW